MGKHNIQQFILAAASLILAGCSNIGINPEESAALQSDYLVISAECPLSAKSDIENGKTTWETGDRISVIYNGVSYEYTAVESGATTTFTSEAGITGWKPGEDIVAYYPPTDEEGTVSILPETDIVFNEGVQENSSKAPLVGTPLTGNLDNGVLKMTFRNIFPVLELRFDAGTVSSPAKSLTVEPADPSDFTGFLSFSGKVNPEDLTLTPDADGEGTAIKVNLPEGTDLRKAQTYKIPVGRFSTGKGLKLTMETADGKTYSRDIYKSGVTSFSEEDGVIGVKHLIKPLYAFEEVAGSGIADAEDLVAFAKAVNEGGSIQQWTNEQGKVVLLDDIDMSGTENWTPIGSGTFSWASNSISVTGGNPFTGYFDGQGHRIINMEMVCDVNGEGQAWGLFGILGPGAVVENLIIDSSCSLSVTGNTPVDCGVVAGLVYDATVRNVTNYAPVSFTGNTPHNIRVTLGVTGFAFADSYGVSIENVNNHADINSGSGENTANGATSVQVGGICGFATNGLNSEMTVEIKDCSNTGDLTTSAPRASGIVASANRYTVITGCENYGNNINRFVTAKGARLGNITCITGTGSEIRNTTNYGDLISETEGAAGGIICLVNSDDNVLSGCANYGRVITDKAVETKIEYCGTFFGMCNKKAEFENCIAGGGIGRYNGGEYQMFGINEGNYMSFIGQVGTNGINATSENITYSSQTGTGSNTEIR